MAADFCTITSQVLLSRVSQIRSGCSRHVRLVLCQNRPGDPCCLVRHGDDCQTSRLAFQECGEPFVRPFRVGFCLPDKRRHSYDKQLAQILVAHPLPGRASPRDVPKGLVIRPNRSFPPLDRLVGVKPNHAANSRPFLNWCPLPMLAAIAEAVTGPTSRCPAGHVYMPERGNGL